MVAESKDNRKKTMKNINIKVNDELNEKTPDKIIDYATEIAFNKLINQAIEDGLFKSDLSKLAFKNLPLTEFQDQFRSEQFKQVCSAILNILIEVDKDEQNKKDKGESGSGNTKS